MRIVRQLGALGLALMLAACSSVPLGTAQKLRGLDVVNDDIAGLLFALDLPLSLEPSSGVSTVGIDIASPSGERLIKAVLVRAEAGELAGTLPPPADNRVYYLFRFADTDKQAIREAQAWVRTLAPGSARLSVLVNPALCRTEAVDPARTYISALVALPGATGLAPLLANVPLGRVARGGQVPMCPGHSG